VQDFFQLLQPGLQLLRPPKKHYKGPLLANMVPYTAQSFTDEWGMQPSQVLHPSSIMGAGYCLSLSVCRPVCVLSGIGRYTLHTSLSVSTTAYSITVAAWFDCLLVCLSVCEYAALTPLYITGLLSLDNNVMVLLSIVLSVCVSVCLYHDI